LESAVKKDTTMKYKHDKEHPVDKLFARKLGNLESMPSENAWQVLQKELSQKPGKKNKALLWLPYAAAAAIALLLVSIWLLRQQMPGSTKDTGLAITKSGQKTDKSAFSPDTPRAIHKPAPLPDTKTTGGQIAMQQEEIKKEADAKENTGKQTAIPEQVHTKMQQNKPAALPVISKTRQKPVIKQAITPLENTVVQLEKQPATLSPSSLVKNESTTIVVTVNLDEEETELLSEETVTEGAEEVQKKTKAGRFFSTLKKIKKGDFDELGIRPETIVAYVKDRASSGNQSENR
jgi:hypothetical protein